MTVEESRKRGFELPPLLLLMLRQTVSRKVADTGKVVNSLQYLVQHLQQPRRSSLPHTTLLSTRADVG